MVLQIILADILLIARIFPRLCGARKNTTQLVKYPRVLSVKPSNKVCVLRGQVSSLIGRNFVEEVLLSNRTIYKYNNFIDSPQDGFSEPISCSKIR